jgi:hypothetical protein
VISRDERWRRAIVYCCLVFFILILAEGILRKWLLNSIQQPLTLVRDPLLLIIYIQYIIYRNRNLPKWIVPFVAVFFLLSWLAFIQYFVLDLDVWVYLIGIRNYIGFVPLSFVMWDVFAKDDVDRVIRLLLYTTLPIAILVVLQFYSPVDSVLNKALDDSTEGIFQVVAGVVRPYGPFTFTAGQAVYSTMALAGALIAVERGSDIIWFRAALLPVLGAAGTMGILSGSRTYFISAAAVFACYLISALTSQKGVTSLRRIALGTAVLAGFLILFIMVFPEAIENMLERQADAVEAEGSTFDRVIFMATEFSSVIGDTPIYGRGIGYGTNAGAFVASGQVGFTLAEYEWTRIIMECGPVLGILVVLMRITFTMWLGFRALKANFERGDSSALIMFGFVGPLVFYAPISGQNTLLSFAWFSAGMVLAMTGPSVVYRKPTRQHWKSSIVDVAGRHG